MSDNKNEPVVIAVLTNDGSANQAVIVLKNREIINDGVKLRASQEYLNHQ